MEGRNEAKKIYMNFFMELLAIYSETYIASHLAIVYEDEEGKMQLYPSNNLEEYLEEDLSTETEELEIDEDDVDYVEESESTSPEDEAPPLKRKKRTIPKFLPCFK